MNTTALTSSGKRLSKSGKVLMRYGTATIGGRTYKTVRIGNQEWLAENLKYDDGGEGIKLRTASPYAGEYYYTWAASDRVASSIGDEWRLPSKSDYESLADAAGGIAEAGKLLKSTSGWNDNDNGLDAFGFAIIAAGAYSGSSYHSYGNMGYFWTKTESDDDSKKAYGIYATTSYQGIAFTEPYKSSTWFSVRLVRNVHQFQTIGDNGYQTVVIGNREWLEENLREDDGEGGVVSSSDTTYPDEKYYTWSAADRIAEALGDGWRLPSTSGDIPSLLDMVGGYTTGGVELKSVTGWYTDRNGKNSQGFNALPTGDSNGNTGKEFKAWSSADDEDYADFLYLYYGNNGALIYNDVKDSPKSVRLVRDVSIPGIEIINGKMYHTVKIGGRTWLADEFYYENYQDLIVNPSSAVLGDPNMYIVNGICFYSNAATQYIESNKSTICPGWHVPTRAELASLLTAAGSTDPDTSSTLAGRSLSAVGTFNKSTDRFGFNARFSGFIDEIGSHEINGTIKFRSADAYTRYLSFGGWGWAMIQYEEVSAKWCMPIRLIKDL